MCIHACDMFINTLAWQTTLSYWVVCVCVCTKLDVNWRQINSHKSFKTVCLMVLVARGLNTKQNHWAPVCLSQAQQLDSETEVQEPL